MKVLHFTTWQERCGIAGYAEHLVDALTGLGVVSAVHPVDAAARKHWSAREIDADLARFVARARDADVVHIQHEYSFFDRFSLLRSNERFARVLLGLRAEGRPFVVTFHTLPPFRDELLTLIAADRGGLSWPAAQYLRVRNRWLQQQWRRRVGPLFTGADSRALVHTRATWRDLVEEGGFGREATRVIPMGAVPRARCALSRAEARARLGLPADAVVASIFGFIQAFKGHEIALRALAMLPSSYHLAIVGGRHPEDSPMAIGRVERLIGELGLAGRVTITGFVPIETLDEYHAASDMCLTPYIYGDLFSGSVGVTWALSSGRPLIASDIPTFRELHDDTGCLLLFEERSAADLARQMTRLAEDPGLQTQLVARARDAVRYWPDVARDVRDIYAEAIAPAGTPAALAV